MKLLTLAALATAIALPATAQTVTTLIAVSPAGLDLASPAGAAVMAGRIDRAALRACGGSDFSARDVQAEVRASACYSQAIGQASADLNAPAVSAALRATLQSGS